MKPYGDPSLSSTTRKNGRVRARREGRREAIEGSTPEMFECDGTCPLCSAPPPLVGTWVDGDDIEVFDDLEQRFARAGVSLEELGEP